MERKRPAEEHAEGATRRGHQPLGPVSSPQPIPAYEPPEVITYRDEDLLAELGPALACSFSGSVISC